ncbi:MAG TPA: glycerol-3-phosphate acyltransferase [Candidatus Binataceae bacterium]|nr:glycerol-3-phosphate acyltransferase [Candidatus Binataceae bacterium]
MVALASWGVLILAYLIGSLPVGVWVGKAFGVDPRAVGSGNVGMTNVARSIGGRAAAITFLGDVLKGLVPVMGGRVLEVSPAGLTLIALAAFLGSLYSIFLFFGGGRGISSGLGIWLGLAPPVAVMILLIFVLGLALTRIVSVGSVSAAIALPLVLGLWGYPANFLHLGLAMALLVLWRHRHNLRRLIRGQEPEFRLTHGVSDG